MKVKRMDKEKALGLVDSTCEHCVEEAEKNRKWVWVDMDNWHCHSKKSDADEAAYRWAK